MFKDLALRYVPNNGIRDITTHLLELFNVPALSERRLALFLDLCTVLKLSVVTFIFLLVYSKILQAELM